jgi:multidrug efflux pump subunit AcrA (membrane-fusion protein)
VVNYKVTFEVQSLEAVQLRDGLTVTVSIIIQERNKVLLVPNAAINYKGGKAYVQVSEDGIAEERAIQTGISNWQYTEVTSGLSEGEKVVVPQGTTTTTTSKQSQSSGVIRIPGVGR